MNPGRMLYTIGATALARGIGALGALALALALGHTFGAAGLGAFAFSQAVCLLCVLVARSGHDTVLLRSVSRAMAERDTARAQGRARFAMRNALKTAAGLTIAVVAWAFANPFGLFDPESRGLLLIMLPAVPAAVLAWQCSGFFKGLRQPARAVLLENGGVVVLTLLAFTVAAAAGLAAEVRTAGYAFLAANLGVMGVGLWLYHRWTRRVTAGLPDGVGPVVGGADRAELADQEPALFSSSRAFFLINVSSYMTEAGSFAVAGLLLAKEQVGLLWAAERLALVIGFIFLVAGPILQPRIAAAFHRGRLDELATLAARARVLCVLAGLPIACLLFLFPHALLTFVGAEFAAAAPYLRIMLIGQVVRIVVGPIHHLLTMTQHEQAMKKLSVILFVVSLAGYPVLIGVFGPTGFAACYAALLAARYLAVVVLVQRAFGFWTATGLRRPSVGQTRGESRDGSRGRCGR